MELHAGNTRSALVREERQCCSPRMAFDHDAPRPAGSVLLLRNGDKGIEVFMVVRHQESSFGAGALVFPGGRVDSGDHAIAEQPDLCPDPSGLDAAAMSYRVAAIRETFEECGILLARSRGSTDFIEAARLQEIEASQRAPLCQGEISFADVLAVEGLELATDVLVPYAHWITPRHMTKRFDTLFFAALAPAGHVGAHDGTESVDSIWITPGRALAEAEAGHRKLMFPTWLTLQKLGQCGSAEAAIEAARATAPVPVAPELLGTEGGAATFRVPAEAGYGGEVFRMMAPA
ncbi:MAG: NUDIX domain-containing protein [Acetobacteraceae bacterium]|nr:NUDIX domain-containing protein [Acetobacteraceae bacterium]